jgi:hypothetical protein
MSVKQKILREYRAKNPIELREPKDNKVRREAMKTKKVKGYIHHNRTFKKLIVGLLAYIFIMVIIITLIFFYIG